MTIRLTGLCAIFLWLGAVVSTTAVAQETHASPVRSAKATIEKLAGAMRFTEGPVWHPDGYLLYSDVPASIIFKWSPGGRNEVFRHPSGEANGNTLDPQGRLVTCERSTRRVSRTEHDGTIVAVADRYNGRRLNNPNDVVVRSDGTIYFTDPARPNAPAEELEIGFNGVFRVAPGGEVELAVGDFARPNGIAFSPGESRLYINDTERRHIRVFDVAADGGLSNGRLFAVLDTQEEGAAPLPGVPDGMKVDVDGNVYCTGPGGIWVFTPDGGRIDIIRTPEQAANMAWGGDDYRTMYITARTGLYRIRLEIPGVPPPGGVVAAPAPAVN